MQAQRELSVQIVEAQGDYPWIAKDNQPEMHEEIALLFQPQQSVLAGPPSQWISAAPPRLTKAMGGWNSELSP